MDEYYSVVFVYYTQMTWITQVYTHTCILSIHSSLDGHLGCFHVLAIVNSTAVNIGHCLQYYPGKKMSGLPFPSPGDLPDMGIGPASPALAGGFFSTEPPGSPINFIYIYIYIFK